MGFGNFLRGIAAQVNPFDKGKTYSSYNPKKKRPEDEQPSNISVGVARPTQRIVVENQNTPTPQRPQNLFQDLNKALRPLGSSQPGVVPVLKNYAAPTVPTPGTVVKPTIPVTTAPAQPIRVGASIVNRNPGTRTNDFASAPEPQNNSIWHRIGRALNIAGQTAAGTVANVPEVGLAAGRVTTGIVGGIPDFVFHTPTAATATATQQFQKYVNNPVTRQINRGAQDINTGVKKALHYTVNDTLDPINRRLDEAAKMYERRVPTAVGGAKVYKIEQPLLNVLAALVAAPSQSGEAVGAAGEVADTVSNASKLARLRTVVSEFLNKPLTSNNENVIAKTGQSIGSRGRPLVEALNTPIKSTKQGVNLLRDVLTNRGVQTAEKGAVDAGEIGNLLNEAQLQDLTTTQIPVGTGIDVTVPPSEPVNIPVRNANTPGNLIQEVGGDAKTATTNAQAARNAINARRVEAAKNADTGLPDRSVEGITPREPVAPFKLNDTTVKSTQDQTIKEYADFLKGVGEGNGTQLVSDGEGGYIRTTNNVRMGETAGKRMTKQDWLDEAERQLKAGKAEPGIQKAFDDASNPDVQQLLSKGEQASAPEGKSIAVKEVTGIPVTDQTNVPTDLPETPGQVRVTTQTSPANAKAEAVAAQTPNPVTIKATEEMAGKSVATGASTETLPASGETDESFLKRVAEDMQTNIQRAVDSLKITKKITKQERAHQAAAGQKAYEEAKAAGLSKNAQDAARRKAMEGAFNRQEYVGSPIHGADEQTLRDLVDEHYSGRSFTTGNVHEAFDKLFHSGESGAWASKPENHIIPSDIKYIKQFLNEQVPNFGANEAGLGDTLTSVIKDIAESSDNASKPGKILGLLRSLKFSDDVSGIGRNNLSLGLAHPKRFAEAIKESFGVMFNEDKYKAMVNRLRSDKMANYLNDELNTGISVLRDKNTAVGGDIFRNSGWAEKIPIAGSAVKASERQFQALRSLLRYKVGKDWIEKQGGIGLLEKAAQESKNPEAFKEAMGNVINTFSGTGDIKFLTRNNKFLAETLSSPGYLASRIQRLNPGYYVSLYMKNPAAALEAAKIASIQGVVTFGTLAAAAKAGLYEDGQIKIGNTRYDITGGLASLVKTGRDIYQFGTGSKKTDLLHGGQNTVDKFIKNQLSPGVADIYGLFGWHPDPKTGEYTDRFGNPITPENFMLNVLTPLNVEGAVKDTQAGTPPVQTAANAALNTLGLGVNTYQTSEDKQAAKVGKNVYKQLQETAKQLEKDKISTNNDDILNYISDGEYDKAQRAREYQLMEIKADPNASPTKIRKAENAVEEVKLHRQGVPIEDDEIQSTIEQGNYDKALQGLNHKLSGLEGASDAKRKPVETDIKRLEVTRDGNFDPSVIKLYQSMSNSEWRKMGDPEDEDYNPDLYQMLWDYDSKMAKAGVSRSDFKPDKQKYSAKSTGGRGRGGSKSIDTSFGQLKAGSFAPQVQKYDTIDAKSSNIPHIAVQRPNIVHKITSS